MEPQNWNSKAWLLALPLAKHRGTLQACQGLQRTPKHCFVLLCLPNTRLSNQLLGPRGSTLAQSQLRGDLFECPSFDLCIVQFRGVSTLPESPACCVLAGLQQGCRMCHLSGLCCYSSYPRLSNLKRKKLNFLQFWREAGKSKSMTLSLSECLYVASCHGMLSWVSQPLPLNQNSCDYPPETFNEAGPIGTTPRKKCCGEIGISPFRFLVLLINEFKIRLKGSVGDNFIRAYKGNTPEQANCESQPQSRGAEQRREGKTVHCTWMKQTHRTDTWTRSHVAVAALEKE